MPADQVPRAFDTARIVDGDRRYDFRSRGAVNLREVFDVGCAVHRQDEEGKRRKAVGAKAAGGAAHTLGGVYEESEDDDPDKEMADASAANQAYVHQSAAAQHATRARAEHEDGQSW